jgi:protein-disulfide isomerase
VKVDDLYAKLTEANIASAGAAAGPAAAPAADAPVVVDLGDSPSRGNKNATVTIVEFSDFQCPFCGRGYATMNEVEKAYEGKVKVVFKQNPLPFHQNAMPAAQASLAAAEQGKFWQMYDQLFTHQTALTRENLDSYAQAIGLDMAKYKAAMDSQKFKAKVDAELDQGRKAGVSGTPTFVINGHKLVGAQPVDQFKQIIDAELAKGQAKGKNVATK